MSKTYSFPLPSFLAVWDTSSLNKRGKNGKSSADIGYSREVYSSPPAAQSILLILLITSSIQ